MASGPLRRIEFLGAYLDLVTMTEAVDFAERAIAQGVPRQHASLSASVVAEMHRDSALRAALRSFDLVTADGQGVVWGGRLLGYRVPGRVTGIDLMQQLLAQAHVHEYSVFLLGAKPAVLARTVAVVESRYPGIRIAGTRHGYFPRTHEAAIVSSIASSGAQLLFVAFSSPERELFLVRNRDELHVPFAMGVGGSFDVLSGRRKRAPRFLQKLGLEWAFRLVQEPRRLGPRYLAGHTRFVGLLARYYAGARVRGRRK